MCDSKVSVIIPIYKTEMYLMKCIDSVIRQTYNNLEIILVNDGSPDNSLSICQKYKDKDKRVIVVNKENGGLSSARNVGLDISTGDYITFVDSDDYLKADAIESLVKRLEKSQAGIAYIHETIVDEQNSIIGEDVSRHSETLYTSSEFLKSICERKVNCAVWGKLFKRNLFQDIRFNEKRLNEDFLLLSEMLLRNSIQVAEDTFSGYYYLERGNSISRSGFGKSLRDAVLNTEEMKNLAEKLASDIVPFFGALALYQARTALVIMTPAQYKAEKEFVSVCRTTIKNNMKYAKHSFIASKDIIFCQGFLLFPRLAIRLVRYIRRTR